MVEDLVTGEKSVLIIISWYITTWRHSHLCISFHVTFNYGNLQSFLLFALGWLRPQGDEDMAGSSSSSYYSRSWRALGILI